MSSNHSEGRRPTSDPKEIAEREITLWNCDLAILSFLSHIVRPCSTTLDWSTTNS